MRLQAILKSKFFLDFAKLSSSGGLGQLLFISCTPLLTRIYSPDQFAQFAIFTSLVAVFYPLFSGRYEFAIVTAKDEYQTKKLFILTILIIIISIFIASIILFFFSNVDYKFLNLKSLNFLIYLVPFGIAAQTFFNTLKLIASRYQKFSIISKSILLNSFLKTLLCIGFGLFAKNLNGLVLTSILCVLTSCVFLFNKLNLKLEFNEIKDLKSLIITAKKFWRYPLFNSLPSVMDNIQNELPVFVISMIYSSSDLANYGIISTIFISPLVLLSTALSQINFSNTSLKIRSGKLIYQDVRNLLFVLLIFIGIPSLIFFLYADSIIPFVFGEQWNDAAIYLQILIPSFFMKIIASTLSTTLISANRNELLGLWQIGSFISSLFVMIFASSNFNFYNFIFTLSLLNTFLYLIYLIMIIYSAKKPKFTIE